MATAFPGSSTLTPEEAAAEALQQRVARLRQLSSEDALPAIYEIVQCCSDGSKVSLPRLEPLAIKRFLRRPQPLSLRVCPTDGDCSVSEAAVVLAAACAALPRELWSGRRVLELGCKAGFTGLAVAALGARVTLADSPHLERAVSDSIAFNAEEIRKRQGSAQFYGIDWDALRSRRVNGLSVVTEASLVISADPVLDERSLAGFVSILRVFMGLDGEAPLCPSLDSVIVAHKHSPTLCIGGYVAPAANARPSVVCAEDYSQCLFHRSLVDAGFDVRPSEFVRPPEGFKHPFIECWEISASGRR
eukprot:TRINITY_DN56897_c0_g1_i1.p1 TRINITY_DN56897_c0_g1~~TRINITY_DN56897_c0_g1_i1.p1  ORF type:complete len:303 (-),score=49.02 TRINITY_DN56897_c0_g1_i1:388-1296(-)